MNTDLPKSDLSTREPGVAIVGISGCAIDDMAVERGVQNLRNSGFHVRNYYQPDRKFQRFGATDAERAAQIHAAADQPDIDIIMALRGSYGLSRLLPYLDYKKLARSGKYFVGYSDFTALQMALLALENKSSIAGPMLCDDFAREDQSELTLMSFFDCINHRRHAICFDSADADDAQASGVLWGGNLAVLTHLVGTSYLPKIDGGILFVEDIAEHPYRVERMMLQLHFAGLLKNQKAIIFGNFSAYKLAPHDNGYNFDEMIRYLRSIIPVPVITGLPFGHIKDKVSLVVGSQATLTSQQGKIELLMDYQL
ncbi:LD-carboxypeptidase [Undibacterium sp. Jales W-56]|uniref:LD-carboxypeptidase n=1 Tax=Undibacterium sp. Jales W-56 TaxID=2897325 RepID=UPI0021D27112|nr:LD-carboxypeptidase [Undibacterium sp. Jales W-56]MCU6433440.1 LD-carboxypeptidase [Undibacterium sp. Jales W-56]